MIVQFLGHQYRRDFQDRAARGSAAEGGPDLGNCLPLATPYDPAEDPPGSIDPSGTVAGAAIAAGPAGTDSG